MPVNEKEYNGNLFDQLTILDDLQEVAEKEQAEETKGDSEKTKTDRAKVISKTTACK